MKVLMLVIASSNELVHHEHKRIWRTYMKSHSDIDCYFIESTPFELETYCSKDTLTMRGTESFKRILHKTIQALEYFLSRGSYDFIIRTNLSSLWKFPQVLAYLATAPTTGFYGGVVNTNVGWPYICGAGIFMSPDICHVLLANKKQACSLYGIDDVDIGYTFASHGIHPTSVPRVDISSLQDITKEGFHYRVRFVTDRHREIPIMSAILSYEASIRSENKEPKTTHILEQSK